MNRRNLLIAVGSGVSIATLGGYFALSEQSSDNQKDTISEEELPKEMENIKPLAVDFNQRLQDILDDPNVYISGSNSITVYYVSDADGGDRLTTEFNEITKKFVESINSTGIAEDDIPLLSMVASNIQAIAPSSSLKEHIYGNLTQNALLETVEITGTVDVQGESNHNHDNHNHG